MEALNAFSLCLNCESQACIAKPAHLGHPGCDVLVLITLCGVFSLHLTEIHTGSHFAITVIFWQYWDGFSMFSLLWISIAPLDFMFLFK